MRFPLAAAFVFLLVAAASTGEAKPITITIFPRELVVGYGKGEVRVEWRIERHPENRRYSFTMENDAGMSTNTEGTLDGQTDPVLFPLCTKGNRQPCFRTVVRGTYIFTACVYRADETRFCSAKKFLAH